MKLSVIIVSYNVRCYLDQCLCSVNRAAEGIESETFVVDNNSSDGSAGMVGKKFPYVNLITNNINLGFSKANNQALSYAKGEYILFLNPDTVVEKKTFQECIKFMDSSPNAGAVGVKMTDGKGRFLPESKRSLPTPLVAFFKISGLTALFPRSKTFGRYYLGHMDNDQTHEIEVLTGAFLFARKEALDKAGWFDEDFFMYGEDIDLSYRILKNKYTIYYHPGTEIIHYKGASTSKSSINYVLVFYRAMIIYAKKHFDFPGAFILLFLFNIAICFRAALSIIRRLTGRLIMPVFDAAIIYAGFRLIPSGWEQYLSPAGQPYTSENQIILIPAIILIWIIAIYLSDGYKDPPKISGAFRGIAYGSLAILLVYAMLSPDWYLKIATIIPLAAWTGLVTSITRLAFSFIRKKIR